MNLSCLDKSYDIRGIFPAEIDAQWAYLFGKAFADCMDGQTVVVGMDARLSGPTLRDALIRGLTEQGKDVVNIGLCSTDMIYFATGYDEHYDAGIMITASHNPKEYNGFKCCGRKSVPLNMKDFGAKMRPLMDGSQSFAVVDRTGALQERSLVEPWVDHILSFIDLSHIQPLKVVADAGSGVAGVFLPLLFQKMGCELIPLFFEPDGNFPFHHPSPIEPENLEDMIRTVRETGADLGVAFDGDADRMYICDETGAVFSGAVTTAIIAETILKKNPGAGIIYNTITSNIVSDVIKKYGGKPVCEYVGHVYIKQKMAQDPSILFGGEHSGHYYFRKNWNGDSGVIAFVFVLDLLCQLGRKASVLRQEYEIYPAITETNFRVASVAETLSAAKARFADAENIIEGDGVTFRYPDFWFNLRPSSNEPLLRCNLEALTQAVCDARASEVLGFLDGYKVG